MNFKQLGPLSPRLRRDIRGYAGHGRIAQEDGIFYLPNQISSYSRSRR